MYDMSIPYSYKCIDKSILLPYYKQYYVSFFFRFVPRWLAANLITIISTGFVVLTMIMAIWVNEPGSVMLAVILAFCLHTYLLGDHLDGMQAKKTGTSSPLGEFLDHYLDVYNGAMVYYTLTVFLGPVPRELFLVLMALNCLAFAATMVEELECRMLVFGWLGTLEGVCFLILFYISWLIPDIRELWQVELYAGYPAYWIVIIGLGLGYVGTVVDILIRVGRVPGPFLMFCIVLSILACLLYDQPVTYLQAWLMMILFSGDYISRVMRGYLQSTPHPYPDFISSALVVAATAASIIDVFDPGVLRGGLVLLTAWLLIKALFSFGQTVYRFREHWNWLNP